MQHESFAALRFPLRLSHEDFHSALRQVLSFLQQAAAGFMHLFCVLSFLQQVAAGFMHLFCVLSFLQQVAAGLVHCCCFLQHVCVCALALILTANAMKAHIAILIILLIIQCLFY